jgi:ABC-type transport system involved in cytochrome c biogenesis permease subunit
MLSRVGIICFAASYAIALALEISRLLFRSGVRGAVMLGLAGAGLVAHSAFLYYRAVHADGTPLSSFYDWYLLAAWVLVVVYLYLVWYHPTTHFGLFLLPLVLGLIATARFAASPVPFDQEPASKVWGALHAIAILLATVAMLLGFAAGLMYLGQAWRLKHHRPALRGLRLPSLEWLERTNSRAVVLAVLMLGMGVAAGAVLNLINYRHHTAPLPWNDPLVVGTLALFLWLLASAVFAAFYRPARQGRKVAYLTVLSFLFLVAALAIGLVINTQHGQLRGDGRAEKCVTAYRAGGDWSIFRRMDVYPRLDPFRKHGPVPFLPPWERLQNRLLPSGPCSRGPA